MGNGEKKINRLSLTIFIQIIKFINRQAEPSHIVVFGT